MDSSVMSSPSEPETTQPKKKRRVDGNEELATEYVASSDVHPLAYPNLVKKSSKDPNRGMYPRSRNRFNESDSSPTFIKASELEKQSYNKPYVHKEKQVASTSAVQSTNGCDIRDFVVMTSKKVTKERLCIKHARRCDLDHVNSASKITKYFNITPSKLPKVKHVQTLASSSQAYTSGWKIKDKEIAKCLHNNERFFKNFSQYYGLLESKTEEVGENFLSKLPLSIAETILCQIPIIDLMKCRLVCSKWKEIIDNERFMEWKKWYYQYKKETAAGNSIVTSKLYNFMKSLDHKSTKTCFQTLLKCMRYKFKRRPSNDMYELLMTNTMGIVADQVLTERFPGWSGKEGRIWCQFTVAVLLCETVWQVYDVYLSLFPKESSCSRPDVTNALYCIALFLLFFRNVDSINFGLHYRVYYTLYMIENDIPDHQKEKLKIVKGLPGQQSIHSYCKDSENSHTYLTYEQIRILNHKFAMNQKIRIIALAGTGKTTTLLHLARMYPQIKFLHLVFNRSMCLYSKKKFPPNVTCVTAHSLAYTAVGRPFNHKLAANIKPFELRQHIKHNSRNLHRYSYGTLVLKTIQMFLYSPSLQLSMNHVPERDLQDRLLSDINRENIFRDAWLIWEKMINKDDKTMKITHDGYLKLYQLTKPKLDHKYQCVLVDEAQDCNPAMLDIVTSLNIPVVLVGDPHQQLYRFRGAENALQNVKATHTYYLTKSFRFGPEIAYIASCVLEHYKKDSRAFTIVGSDDETFISGRTEGQYAVITKTNVKLFTEAIRMLVDKNLRENEPTVINAAFAGGIAGYGFDQLIELYKLKEGPTSKEADIKDKFISMFETFEDISNYAVSAEDGDLTHKIDLVNRHGNNIINYVKILKEKCSHPIELANVVFSTTHKAKGLEFDTVYLAEDFGFNCSLDNPDRVTNLEDVNILYVALTRAKKCLLLPEKLKKILFSMHEKFEYPVASQLVLGDKTRLTCCSCESTFVPHTVLLMYKCALTLANGREITGGPLCVKCGSDPHMRPEVHVNQIVMYLDPTRDNTHQFWNRVTGPLPSDPKIVYDTFARFEEPEEVFVINVNLQ